MKRLRLLCFALLVSTITIGQNVKHNSKGIVKEVEFHHSKSKSPNSSAEFKEKYLKVSVDDEFKLKPHKRNRKGFKNERYEQFYKGIKVENASYTFHFKDDTLVYAHGNYVRIIDVNTKPTLSPDEAKANFAKFKKIPIDSVFSYSSELLIKEIKENKGDTITIPVLVYKIDLDANDRVNDEIGYVDAHTGKIVATAPKIWGATYNGIFTTRYNGTKVAKTSLSSSSYILKDDSRSTIIHTKNLNNSNYIPYAVDITDNDNSWTSSEHRPNNNDMGLDVHWALQEIYDYFNDNYSISSYGDDDFQINAYIKYGYYPSERDNAGWDPSLNLLIFGEGYTNFNPVASLDAVAHEYGHGISDIQIGMPYDYGTMGAIQEGLSDIWGVILESAINPVDIWKIGDQVVKSGSCLRNIENPTDGNSKTQLSVTYGASSYNNASDHYVKSGVLSYWFYLLVNGGTGVNEKGDYYSLSGIRMNDAEAFITNCIYDGYLDGVNSFSSLYSAFSNAATIFYGTSSFIKNQVDMAWYAVGVAPKPSEISISGEKYLCPSSQTAYYANNLSGAFSWVCSSNLTPIGGSSGSFTTSSTRGNAWVAIKVNGIEVTRKNIVIGSEVTGIDAISTAGTNRYYASPACSDSRFNVWTLTWQGMDYTVDQPIVVFGKSYVDVVSTTNNSNYTIASLTLEQGNYSYTKYITANRVDLGLSGIQLPNPLPFSLNLSPNPANESTTITLTEEITSAKQQTSKKDKTETEFQLWNSYGKLKSYKTKSNKHQISLSGLPSGIYYVIVIKDKNVYRKQLIVD